MSAHGGHDADPPDADAHAWDGDGAGDQARRDRLIALLNSHGPDGDGPEVAAGGVAADGGAGGSGDVSRLRKRLGRVCVLSTGEVGVDGAGVTVMGSLEAGRAGARDQLAATGALTRRLEDLQLTAGEGPCLDAYDGGSPVLAGDLAAEATRWLGFGPEAIAAGAAAVFSLPLQVGAVRLGTLDLNRASTGALSREQLADALALATLATEILLELAEHPDVPDDPDTTDAPDADPQRWPGVGWLPDVHAEVHIASGMVSAQQAISVGVALLRIRAHAFATGEAISDVAQRIIDRELVLEDPGAEPADPDGPPAPDPENNG